MAKVAPAPDTGNNSEAKDFVNNVIDTAAQNVEAKLDAKDESPPQPDVKPDVKPDVNTDLPPVPAPAPAEAKISRDDIIEAQKIVSKMDPVALASLINAASVASKEVGGKKTRRRRKNKSKSAKRRR